MIGRTGPLVDRLRAGWIEFLLIGVLVVAQHEDNLAGLARLKLELEVMGADWSPAVGYRVERLAALDRRRPVPAAVGSQEQVALCVKAGQWL